MPASWHDIARPLVERYGAEAVKEASLSVLKFPALLVNTLDEVKQLSRFLSEQFERFERKE